MRTGFAALTVAYVLSQFYRAFLAVLAPVLDADIGASAEDLAFASGIWLAAFAGLQLPIGYALDHLGPRRTAGGLVLAAVGAAIFALAQGPVAVTVAMALIGAGCAPALMVSLYIFARAYPPAMFASLTGLLMGVSSVGNLAAATPTAWAAEAFGWRACLWGLAITTLLITLALVALVRDPPRATSPGRDGVGFLALMRTPAVLLLVPLTFAHYAPVAGVRGLWVGPYLADVFHLDAVALGNASLAMGIAMILGSFAYGPLDRLLGTRKGVLFGGNLALAAALLGLWAWPAAGLGLAVALLCAVGFFGSSYPLMIAHGRSFFPHHLAGRGVTFLNLLAMGGAGLAQIASGRVYAAATSARPADVAGPYAVVFLFFGLLVLVGCVPYALTRDRLD
ncbi:MAG: MFS transporter [Amaricoccus sp.]|uniref:MFS transporter n=1 Tax=Amaricoccus sp. TaxID=1872485 RepID=UPI001D6EDF7B|nr:MFS transporter [Amaricoccus sp.]MCB1370788.1 MFS transporter [Paracoccaceae bacterium]HRW16711.1 MFS transporter [Amaricoccus sp.]